MAIREFNVGSLSKYYFDTDLDVVMSRQRSTPRPMKWVMKWVNTSPYSTRRVGLTNDRGCKVSLSYEQIMTMLKPAVCVTPAITQSALDMRPGHDFIMFSTSKRCSQYFTANTTIGEAMAVFQKRGLPLDPKELQILNPQTGKISKLKVKVVETYTLD